MEYIYKTQGVCAAQIKFDIEGNIISNVVFSGGCPGNLKAIAKLVDGMSVEEIEAKLSGNTCKSRPTSCGDQLAKAVRQAYEQNKN